MDYSQYGGAQYGSAQYGSKTNQYQYPPGYQAPAQQYEPTPPQIRNPFAPPPPPRSRFAGPNANFDPEYEAQLAQWQSAYAPQDQLDRGKKANKGDRQENANYTAIGVRPSATHTSTPADAGDAKAKAAAAAASAEDAKTKTVVRKGGGQTWEDTSLLEWDPTQFRIMVGNLAGEVTDDSLAKAFAAYGVAKARVVRDKRTTKSRGYGFVAFTDSDAGFRAAREMLNKYIGSHPVTIKRSTTDVKPVVHKDKGRGKGKNNRNRDKGGKKVDDVLAANTGAHIEKKPVRNPAGLKVLG